MINRRKFLTSTLALGGGLAFQSLLPAWAQSGARNSQRGITTLEGASIELDISESIAPVAGRRARQILVNGQLPAPLLRWREGEEVTLRVRNLLREPTSIHWHGILLPFHMDGVPGISFPGIAPGETFVYRFPVRQGGTYWYHSHSGFQEQLGHYGPIVIEPRGGDPVAFDREYVVVLSDWSFEDPGRIFAKLKKMSDNYNFQQRTVFDFFRDVKAQGLDPVLAERMMWGSMRMSPTDIADVTGATYTFLLNGHSPAENWTGLFNPGERVRLRLVNASSMSIFNIRIPGLPMTVVQADGLDVEPVETDEFQIGTAETFDVIVQPREDRAYTLMCESNDRSGYARATLAPREGMSADVPPLRPRPTLSMKDMAMDHSGMDHSAHATQSASAPGPADHSGMDHSSTDHSSHGATAAAPAAQDPGTMDHSSMDHSSMDHSSMDHSSMVHSSMDHSAMDSSMDHSAMDSSTDQSAMDHADMDHGPAAPETSPMDHAGHAGMDHAGLAGNAQGEAPAIQGQAHDHPGGPGVAGMAENPVNRLGERPLGLENEPHRVLVYTDLRSLAPNPDTRTPARELELHLTSNMERYMWSFDGRKFSEVHEPIVFRHGERLRLTLVNDTMMPHPIHLHGMFFDVVTGEHAHKPRKHTIVVKPGERMSVDVTADAPGDWAFHCHLLYHMMAGMMRTVAVIGAEESA